MVVSSLLMYRVPASRKVEKPSSDGKDKKVALTWEFRYGFVLHNYLTGWFLIDLLSVTERLSLTLTLTLTLTEQQDNMTVALCSMMTLRMEAPHLLPWIAYHLLIGVDQIHLYHDDRSRMRI